MGITAAGHYRVPATISARKVSPEYEDSDLKIGKNREIVIRLLWCVIEFVEGHLHDEYGVLKPGSLHILSFRDKPEVGISLVQNQNSLGALVQEGRRDNLHVIKLASLRVHPVRSAQPEFQRDDP